MPFFRGKLTVRSQNINTNIETRRGAVSAFFLAARKPGSRPEGQGLYLSISYKICAEPLTRLRKLIFAPAPTGPTFLLQELKETVS